MLNRSNLEMWLKLPVKLTEKRQSVLASLQSYNVSKWRSGDQVKIFYSSLKHLIFAVGWEGTISLKTGIPALG